MNTEHEQGTFVRTRSRHNGYYAGDFSNQPFPSRHQLDLVMHLRRPAVGRAW